MNSLDDIQDRLAMAERHVAEGRKIVAGQEQCLEHLSRIGADTEQAKDQLKLFKQTLEIFEYDYRAVKQEIAAFKTRKHL